MIRVLLFLIILAALALGFGWIADRPGDIVLHWQGTEIETSLMVAIAAVLLLAVVLSLLWTVVRLLFRAPSLMGLAARSRRRQRGLEALSRGLVAAGAGDARTARRAADEASRQLGNEPMTLLLRAQVAQLGHDRTAARAVFAEMAERADTRLLGLRGLHVEAQRAGDHEAAHQYAAEAHRTAPVAWAGRAVLADRAGRNDWAGALATIDRNAKAGLIDKPDADRQRAVVKTALAEETRGRDPAGALRMALEAVKAAPDLEPARALAARLQAQRGDLKGASRLIERGWREAPHPDLARAYVDLRPGDSTGDRLERAKTLASFWPDHAESRLMLARVAMDARDFALARRNLEPLTAADQRPTVRTCLAMAELDEAEHGDSGAVRAWLGRAARAPRDPAWIADGVVSDAWAPVSPTTGKLDAFRWGEPPDRLGPAIEAAPPPPREPPPMALPEPTPEIMPAVAEAAPIKDIAEPEVLPPPAEPPPRSLAVVAPDDPGPETVPR